MLPSAEASCILMNTKRILPLLLACAACGMTACVKVDLASSASFGDIVPVVTGVNSEAEKPLRTTATTPADPEAGFSYKYEDGSVLVQSASGTEVQKLSLPEAMDASLTPTVLTSDFNFDSHTDIYLQYAQGVSNAYYHFWLWDEDKESFVYNEELSKLTSPKADAAMETITSYNRISAAENEDATYVWTNDGLALLQKTTQLSMADGSLKCITYAYDTDKPDAKPTVAEEYTLSPAAALEREDAIFAATQAAVKSYNDNQAFAKVAYHGTVEVNGTQYHHIACSDTLAVIVDVYVKVGDLKSMLATPADSAEKYIPLTGDGSTPAVTTTAAR